MEKRVILKNTLILSLPAILKFFIGLLRAKIVATYLGPLGSGVISQFQTMLNALTTITKFGIIDGTAKQIAQANSGIISKEEIPSILKTTISIILFILIFIIFFSIIFRDSLIKFFFGDISYKKYFVFIILSFPLSVISSIFYTILRGYKKIEIISKIEIYINIILFLLFYLLVNYLKLTGAIINIFLGILITTYLFYVYSKNILNNNQIKLKTIIFSRFNKIYFKELISFMFVFFVSGIFELYTDLFCRNILISKIGIKSLGLYTPIQAWSNVFMGFILPSITTYLFPRFSEVKNNNELVLLANDIIRILLFISLPFITMGITLRNFLIPFFYSNEFIEASKYLPYHFISIYFVIINFILAQFFATTGKIYSFIPIIIFNNILSLAIVYFLVPKYGLWGWMLRHTLIPTFAFFIYYIFWYKKINFRFSKDNMHLIFFILISSLLMLFFSNYIFLLIILNILTLVIEFFLLTKKEREKLLVLIFSLVKLNKD